MKSTRRPRLRLRGERLAPRRAVYIYIPIYMYIYINTYIYVYIYIYIYIYIYLYIYLYIYVYIYVYTYMVQGLKTFPSSRDCAFGVSGSRAPCGVMAYGERN